MDPLRRLEEISHKLKELQRLTHESPQLRLRLNDEGLTAAPCKDASQSRNRACAMGYHQLDAGHLPPPQHVRALGLSACWADPAVQRAEPGRCHAATRTKPASDRHALGRKPSLHRSPTGPVRQGTTLNRSLKPAVYAPTAHNRFHLRQVIQTKHRTKTSDNRRPSQSAGVRTATAALQRHHTLPVCTCPPRTSPCPMPLNAGEVDSLTSTISPAHVRDPYPRIRAPPRIFAPRHRQQKLLSMARCLLRDTCTPTNQPRESFVLGCRTNACKGAAKCTCRLLEISSSDAAGESDQCIRINPIAPLACPYVYPDTDTDDGSHSAHLHCNAAVPLRAPQTQAVSAACSPTNVSLVSALNQTDQPKHSASCGTLTSLSQASAQVSTTSLCRRADTKAAQISTTSLCKPAETAAAQVSTSSLCKRAVTSVQCSPSSKSSSRHLLTVPTTRPLSPVCSSHFVVQGGVTVSDYNQSVLLSPHDSGVALSAHRSQACQNGGQTLCRSQSASAVHSTAEAAVGQSLCQLPRAKSVQAFPTATMSAKSTCTAPAKGQSDKAVAVGQPAAHACTSTETVTPAPQPKTCTAGTSHTNFMLSTATCTTALNNTSSFGTSHIHITAAKSTCAKVSPDTSNYVQTEQPTGEARSVAIGPSIHSVCSNAKHSKSVQLHATCCDQKHTTHSPPQNNTERRTQVKRLLTEVARQQAQEREQKTMSLTDVDHLIKQQPSSRATAHAAPSSSSQLGKAVNALSAANGSSFCGSRIQALSADVVPSRAEPGAVLSYRHAHSPTPLTSAHVLASQPSLQHKHSPLPLTLNSHKERSALLTPSLQATSLVGPGHHSSNHHLSPSYVASPLGLDASSGYPSVHETTEMMNLVDQPSLWPAHNASQLTVTFSAESAVSYFPSTTSFFSHTSLPTALAAGPPMHSTDEAGGSEPVLQGCPLDEMSGSAGRDVPEAEADGNADTCPIPATTPSGPVAKELKEVAVGPTYLTSGMCRGTAERDKGQSGDGLDVCNRELDDQGRDAAAVQGALCPCHGRCRCSRRTAAATKVGRNRVCAGMPCTANRIISTRQRQRPSHRIKRRYSRQCRSINSSTSRGRRRVAACSLAARGSDISTDGFTPRSSNSSGSPTPATLSPGRIRSEGELVHKHLFRAGQLDLPSSDDGQTRTPSDNDVDWGRLLDTLVHSADDVNDDHLYPSLSDSTAIGSLTRPRQKLTSARVKRRSTSIHHQYRIGQHGRNVTNRTRLTCQQPCCTLTKWTNQLPIRYHCDLELSTDETGCFCNSGCRSTVVKANARSQRIPFHPCRRVWLRPQVKSQTTYRAKERDGAMPDFAKLATDEQVPEQVWANIHSPAADYRRNSRKQTLLTSDLSDSDSDCELGQLIIPQTLLPVPRHMLALR